jgi:N-acetyl-gamma-glutamyl-phosphate reductase
MKYKVYVDGQEGTTGLKINERLAGRTDIEMLKIPTENRKDIETRKEFLNNADIVFLCLPDTASREAVSLVQNDKTRVIDASTAFRTDPDWAYGIPELDKNSRELIKLSKRVSVPGCHATGFNMALYPLIKGGIVPVDYPVTCHSVTGYSGGGKKLINLYEGNGSQERLQAPRHYALGLKHKHIPEMQAITGLKYPPIFTPIVSNYFNGMAVVTPLFSRLLSKPVNAQEVHAYIESWYKGERFVRVVPFVSDAYLDEGYLNPMECNETNKIDIFVFGNQDQILVVSRFDNLGKGASGAAVQNLNIMIGVDEGTGLE